MKEKFQNKKIAIGDRIEIMDSKNKDANKIIVGLMEKIFQKLNEDAKTDVNFLLSETTNMILTEPSLKGVLRSIVDDRVAESFAKGYNKFM